MYKKAFTLVEMMIVIAIIAVLAGVAMPQYNKYIRKSESTTIISMLNELKNAEIVYKALNGNYLTFGASGGNHNASKLIPFRKLSLDVPKNNYDYYVVNCSNGPIPGVIVKIRKLSGRFIYLTIPSNMSLGNRDNSEFRTNGFFTYDYVNDVDSGKAPNCS